MVYDWIVVGNGITGAAASYELVRLGFSVLLVEQHDRLQGATRHSYGGIAYWAATTPLQQQLCEEGIERHRQFSDELGTDTQFQERNLILTIAPGTDPATVASSFASCAIPPQLIDRQTAWDMEPLLNPDAISGALTVRHGHVDPEVMVNAYNTAFRRAGGVLKIGQVVEVVIEGDRVAGVKTQHQLVSGKNVVICTGGWTRHFLDQLGIPIQQYFTHAESIQCPDPGVEFNTFVTSAIVERFKLEHDASHPRHASVWNTPGQEVLPHVLDAGAIQFKDGQVRMGQISRVLTDPAASINSVESEQAIRDKVGTLLPCLRDAPGQWNHCLVAFSGDDLPLIGPLPAAQGLFLFSGFSHPFAFVPPLAQRFANHVNGAADDIIAQLAPDRFIEA